MKGKNEITIMRNSLLLIMLGTTVAFGTSSSLRAQAPPATTKPNQTNEFAAAGVLDSAVVFEWKAGPLVEFVAQIKKVFGIDLHQRADIPGGMLDVRVPSMKIETANVWHVLDLYNSISDDHPESGKWAVKRLRGVVLDSQGSFMSEPNAIFLVPSMKTDKEDSRSVRAFTLRDIPGEEQKQLFELINVEGDRLKGSFLGGDIHFHKETEICVATGSKTYVEMVGSLIDAFREGRQKLPSVPKPYSPKSPKPQDEK